jgi:hypothetical protein
MVMVWVWVQIQRKMLGSAIHVLIYEGVHITIESVHEKGMWTLNTFKHPLNSTLEPKFQASLSLSTLFYHALDEHIW